MFFWVRSWKNTFWSWMLLSCFIFYNNCCSNKFVNKKYGPNFLLKWWKTWRYFLSFKRAKSSAFNGAYIAKWIRPLDFKFVLYKFDQLYLCFNSSQIRCADITIYRMGTSLIFGYHIMIMKFVCKRNIMNREVVLMENHNANLANFTASYYTKK